MAVIRFALLLSVAVGIVVGSPKESKKPFSLNRRSDGFPYPLDDTDKLEESLLPKFEAYLAKKNTSSHGCTLENAIRRQEWHDLTIAQRQEYITAVLCLQSKPPKANTTLYPGVKNRYDDFVLTHETQAFHLHSTPHLFPAHRYYIWAYEKALREECGYTGYQPYWNWGRTAADPKSSPLFNGNMSSMGGNGLPSNYSGVKAGMGFMPPYDVIPPAGGGGCVTEGPFKNMVVSLGPIGGIMPDTPPNPRSDGFGANPRCLRRDVNKYASAQTFDNYTYALITKSETIDKFQEVMLGTPAKNDWGVHMAGHYTIGGDPGGDFFSSPGDPVFWFHHGMVDRIWWIWQMQDPENRMNVLPENPPKDDIIDLNWTAGPVNTWDLNDSIGGNGGAFCYIYV